MASVRTHDVMHVCVQTGERVNVSVAFPERIGIYSSGTELAWTWPNHTQSIKWYHFQ